jgi:outer membrane protein assembly factor BamB
VAPSWDGKLYAVHADSGKLLWTAPIAEYTRGSPAIANGRVYVGDEGGAVHCLDVATGSSIWTAQVDGRISGCPVVTPSGILVATDRGGLTWLGPDGKTKWHHTLPGRLTGQPTITTTQVFVPHESGVAVLQQADGRPDTRLRLPAFKDKVLSVTPYDGRVFVLGAALRIEVVNGQSFTFQDVNVYLWEPKAELAQ